MPVLDGLEATRLIKAAEELRDAKVIAYTANASIPELLAEPGLWLSCRSHRRLMSSSQPFSTQWASNPLEWRGGRVCYPVSTFSDSCAHSPSASEPFRLSCVQSPSIPLEPRHQIYRIATMQE